MVKKKDGVPAWNNRVEEEAKEYFLKLHCLIKKHGTCVNGIIFSRYGLDLKEYTQLRFVSFREDFSECITVTLMERAGVSSGEVMALFGTMMVFSKKNHSPNEPWKKIFQVVEGRGDHCPQFVVEGWPLSVEQSYPKSLLPNPDSVHQESILESTDPKRLLTQFELEYLSSYPVSEEEVLS